MKFAKIDFIDNLDEIPIKFNLYKKEKILNWYIKKFNPYIKEELNILGISGYKIKLPITRKVAYEDSSIFEELYKKTIKSLKSLDVCIVEKPYEFFIDIEEDIITTNKEILMVVFMFEIILKVIKILNKDLKNLEIIILDGNRVLTEMLINSIYENINYLTVITEEDYGELIDSIFYDNGLNVGQMKKSNSLISTADIVINLKEEDFKDYSLLKSGAVFIDLTKNIKSILNVCIKREDVLVIDSINVALEDEICTLENFEMAYYFKSNMYRCIKEGNITKRFIKKVEEEIKENGIKLSSFKRLDKTLNSVYYTKFRNKINNNY